MAIESNKRSAVEDGIVALDRAVDVFERLSKLLDFARAELDPGQGPAVRALFPGRARVGVLDVLAHWDDLMRLAGPDDPHAAPVAPVEANGSPDRRSVLALRRALRPLAEDAVGLSMIPPTGSKKAEPSWFAPGHVIMSAVETQGLPDGWNDLLVRLVGMQAAVGRGDGSAFTEHLRAYQASTEAMARARGEYDKVGLEVFLGDLDPFHRGAYLYLLALLVVALGWLASSRWQRRAAWALMLGVLALHVAGIVIRCVLRERPPISTLYETVLFVSALAVGACLVAERIDRRGIAMALAPVLGGLGLFVANKFEALKGEDTMPQLQAVLDTNFWLATHVTCIAIGYSGGLLASAIAHVTVLGRALGLKRGDEAFHRAVSRMTYGMLCFGLLFSVVGTILGGIWANESWGRFWGWDPKENGALMICLVQIAILHGRLGGYLKASGLALATIAAGCVVAFSWWGVNLLQIGLHSYGFMGGVWTGLLVFYGVEGAVLLVGVVDAVRRR
jgi:ABC-type transport system involved in cytochrome c biogenesis permease subunit